MSTERGPWEDFAAPAVDDGPWNDFQASEPPAEPARRVNPAGQIARGHGPQPQSIFVANKMEQAKGAWRRGVPEVDILSALRDAVQTDHGPDDDGTTSNPFDALPAKADVVMLREGRVRRRGAPAPYVPKPVDEGFGNRLLEALGGGTLAPAGGTLQLLGETFNPWKRMLTLVPDTNPAKVALIANPVTDPVESAGRTMSAAGKEMGERALAVTPHPTFDSTLRDPTNALQFYTLLAAQSAPAMALAVATRNPELATDVVGALTGAQSYGEDRLGGDTHETALVDAMTQALLEKGFEGAPMEEAMGAGSLARRALRAPASEAATEALTGPAQYAVGQTLHDKPVDDAEVVRQALDSAIVGAGLGGQSVGIDALARVLDSSNVAEDTAPRMDANSDRIVNLLAELIDSQPKPLAEQKPNSLTDAIRQGLNPAQGAQDAAQARVTPARTDEGSAQAPAAPQGPQEPDLEPRIPPLPDLEPGVTRESLIAEYANAASDDERAAAAARLAAHERRNLEQSSEAEAEEGPGQEGGQEGQGQGNRRVPEQEAADEQGPVAGDRMALESPIGLAAQAGVARVKDAPRLVVHSDYSTMPQGMARDAQASGGTEGIEGAYDDATDTIHIFAAGIDDPERAQWVVDHEIGHALIRSHGRRQASGISSVLQEAARNSTVSDVVRAMSGQRSDANIEEAMVELLTAYQRNGWDHIEQRYGVKVPREMREGAQGVFRRVIESIRKIIAKVTGRASFTNAQVYQLLEQVNAERAMPRKKKGEENGNQQPGQAANRAGVLQPAARPADAGARASADAKPAEPATVAEPVAEPAAAGDEAAREQRGSQPVRGDGADRQQQPEAQRDAGTEDLKNGFVGGTRVDPKTHERVPASAFKRRPDETFEEWEKRVLELQRNTIVFSRQEGPARDMLQEFLDSTAQNPFGRERLFLNDKGEPFAGVELSRGFAPDEVMLNAIRTFEVGRRNGSAALRLITALADKHGVRLRLSAVPFGEKALKKSELVAWYKRHGFEGKADRMERLPASMPDDTAESPLRLAGKMRIVFSRAKTRGALLRDLTETEQKKVTEKVAEKVLAQLKALPRTDDMAAAALAGRAKRGWYEQSAQTISDVFGPDGQRFAMLLAALSPQTSVETNLTNALNTWKNWIAAGRPTERDEIVRILGQSVEGARGAGSVLPAWINNSVRALGSEVLDDVVISGPKVNSFYQNLVGNVQEVTNDAWMASFANVNQTIFKGGLNASGTEPGKGTGYLAMNAQIRRTARQLTEMTGETWTPAEVQETIWSWAKTLYELADSAGETRSMEQLVVDQAVTDELIASTPDFATLFTDPKYAAILKEAGYGEEVRNLAGRNAAREAGEKSGARGKASAPDEAALRRSARRLDQVRRDRLAGEPADDVAVPFSRKLAKNVYGPVQGTDLKGLPVVVDVPGRGRMEFHGFEPAQAIAREFASRHGHELPRDYVRVNPEQAESIADAYQAMKHDPENVWVKRAYDAMIRETLEQYEAMLATGLVVEFIDDAAHHHGNGGGVDPYAASPRLAILDVVENNHLWVFPTTSGFGDNNGADPFPGNPLLQETKYEISGRKAVANDIFRAVHDYFGHIANGVGFRADGEENAWREHSAMYSPLARQAMTTETRGQNSWVNYGPYGEENRTASSADTHFADQKTGLLPRWVIDNVPQAPEITQTPAFKKWFADSKVVDADGNPLQVFHGTISPEGFQFTEFSPRTGRNGSPKTVNAIGSWFSDNPEHGNIFSGSAADPNTGGIQRSLADIRAGRGRISEGAQVIPVYLSIQNPLEVRDGDHMQQLWEDWGMGKGRWSKGEPEFFRDRMKAAGYDGIHFQVADKVDNFRERGEYWVALESTQIKSAIGNNGNFDPWEENITFSRFNAKKQQPDAVAVNAVHYSNTPNLSTLDPKKAGSAGAGRERRRFGTGIFGEQGGTSARVAFYVHEDGATTPPAEDVVRAAGGVHPYGVRLTNLYDLDADPRDLVTRNVDETEEAISEAGFDGFVTGGQSGIDGRVAVVYDIGKKKIPVEPINDIGFSRARNDQFDTPEFKRWFGRSKVVNEDGAPRVVYHGTAYDFTRFDGYNTAGWFSEDPGLTDRHTSSAVISQQNFDDEELAQQGGTGKLVYPVYLSIQNPAHIPGDMNDPMDVEAIQRAFPGIDFDEDFAAESPMWMVVNDHDFITQLEGMGYDGLFVIEDGVRTWAAFQPQQIKSATGNTGAFDPSNMSILFSRGVPLPPPNGVVPFSHQLDELREKLQDRMLRLRRAQEHVGPISDAMDAYTLENLMYGSAKDKLDAVDRDFIKPLLKRLKASGLSTDQLQDYLLARHAPERNAQVATVNPQVQDAGSGITTADANGILAGTVPGPYSGKVLTRDQIAAAASAARIIDAMVEQTLDTLVQSQQITPQLAATLRATYKHYVPLVGDQNAPDWFDTFTGTGKGLSVGRSGIKRALGRGKDNVPFNILGEVAGKLQRAIVQGEKAKVTQAFLDFAIAHPMPDLYTVNPVDMEWKFSPATGQAYLGVKSVFGDNERSIVVPRNGKFVRIRFEDERLRDAILHMNVQDLSGFVKYAGAINRWRSAVLTRFNPAFTPINILRDLQFGMSAVLSEHGGKTGAETLVNYLPALRALWRDIRNPVGNAAVPDPQKSMDDWAREYAETGVKTGLTQIDDVVDLQRRMATGAMTVMQLAAEGRPWDTVRESVTRALDPVLSAVEDINDVTENALRLGVYVSLRKQGWSKTRAGAYAKNVTINFNRKGSWGPVIGAIYLFYNAAMQGAHATQRVMRKPAVQAMLVAMAGLQAMFASMMMGDDDDDGITDWDMVPDYVKRTSLVIPTGVLSGKGSDYFALPMPYGFNLFPYAGGRLAQWAEHGARPTDNSTFMDVTKSATEAFSPVPLTEGYSSLFGDTMGSLMNLAANKDDMGRPITPTNPYSTYEVPAALQGRSDTPRAYQVAAQLMAKVGGGDLEKRIPPVGFLDASPEQLEYMTNFAGGGLTSLVNKSTRWWELKDADILGSPMEAIGATPIAGRMLGSGNEARAVADRYYAERGIFNRELDRMKERVRAGQDPDKALSDAQAEVPALEGVTLDRYSRSGSYKRRGDKDLVVVKGQVKMSETGAPKLKAEPGSPFKQLKQSEQVLEDVNRAIVAIRDPGTTNAQVVAILEGNVDWSTQRMGKADPLLDAAGLPQDTAGEPAYNGEAVAPERVRQRAIKALQAERERVQKLFLQSVRKARSE